MQALAFSPDDSLLAGGTAQAKTTIWDPQLASERSTLADSNYTFRLAAPNKPGRRSVRPPGAPITLYSGTTRRGRIRRGNPPRRRPTDRQIYSGRAGTKRRSAHRRDVRQDDRLAVRVNDLPLPEVLRHLSTAPESGCRLRPGVAFASCTQGKLRARRSSASRPWPAAWNRRTRRLLAENSTRLWKRIGRFPFRRLVRRRATRHCSNWPPV